jgi:NIMA (never in mitosis gene a)-related kinase
MSLNEVRLLSRLDHPHIIAFYDSFEEEGILMIEVPLIGKCGAN